MLIRVSCGRLSRTLEGGGGSLRQSGRRWGRLPRSLWEEGAAAQGTPGGGREREGAREEDHVATRGQFIKNPRVFFIFYFFKPIQMKNIKQMKTPRVFFILFIFFICI